MKQLVSVYLSEEHLRKVEEHCPTNALPSDIARSGKKVRQAYTQSILGMMAMMTGDKTHDEQTSPRAQALALVALCVGAMVLARTVDNTELAEEIRLAAEALAHHVLD